MVSACARGMCLTCADAAAGTTAATANAATSAAALRYLDFIVSLLQKVNVVMCPLKPAIRVRGALAGVTEAQR